ncbi:hypothetical protein FOA52_006709 [Chlamydomonas sp. UWO 241]|nr:hypothetical protein FOA52_006709 [Chlamydomonas sp. UWO 241]
MAERLLRMREKLGVSEETVEAGKLDAEAKRRAIEAELTRADEFFRLLGWHSGADKHLLNALLQRALYVARLRAEQVEANWRAKGQLADASRELSRAIAREGETAALDPGARARRNALQAELREVKAEERRLARDGLPPLEWDHRRFRHDGLDDLQASELEVQRQVLTTRWQKQSAKKHGRMDWDVDEEVMMMETLPVCVRLLSSMPLKDLSSMLRVGSRRDQDGGDNLPDGGGLDEEAGLAPRRGGGAGAKGLIEMQVYNDNAPDDVKAEQLRIEAARKALDRKKLAVYRALCAMRFVEETRRREEEREARQAQLAQASLPAPRPRRTATATPSGRNSILASVASRSGAATPGPAGGGAQRSARGGGGGGGQGGQSQDEFFQRLRDDIDRRRHDMEARASAKVEGELNAMRSFRAKPFTPAPGTTRRRDASPGHGDDSARGGGGARGGGESGTRSPRAMRTGGGFLMFHPDHAWYDDSQGGAWSGDGGMSGAHSPPPGTHQQQQRQQDQQYQQHQHQQHQRQQHQQQRQQEQQQQQQARPSSAHARPSSSQAAAAPAAAAAAAGASGAAGHLDDEA